MTPMTANSPAMTQPPKLPGITFSHSTEAEEYRSIGRGGAWVLGIDYGLLPAGTVFIEFRDGRPVKATLADGEVVNLVTP